MDSLEKLVERLNTMLGLPNSESYVVDIIAILAEKPWRTRQELYSEVETIRCQRFNETVPKAWLISPRTFFRRHIIGRYSSPLLIGKVLKILFKKQFVIRRSRTVQRGIIVSEVGYYEYALHPTQRIQIDGGKRAHVPAALVPARATSR